MSDDSPDLEALKVRATEAVEAYYAFDELEADMHELSGVADKVMQILRLTLTPTTRELLKKCAQLADEISRCREEIEREADSLKLQYALAATGLKFGDKVHVKYPTGREFLIRVERAEFHPPEALYIHGTRVLKSGKAGKSREWFDANSVYWRKCEE